MEKIGNFGRRDLAIDMFRALTMVLMIFVNDLWTIKGMPHWLLHSQTTEDFMGLSDYVFPAFLFAMGMSIPYAIENRFRKGLSAESTLWHILKRGFALVVMGVFSVNAGSGLQLGPQSRNLFLILMTTGFFLVWNEYPKGRKWTRILRLAGVVLLGWMALRYRTPEGGIFAPKWWGILGLIGWAYLFCATAYLLARDNLKILLGIWLGFVLLCILSTGMRSGHPIVDFPEPNVFDRLRDVLRLDNGAHHALAMGGIILSVVSAEYAPSWSRKACIGVSLAVAAALIGAGFFAHRYFIASKNLATLPWVLWVMAPCVVLYTLLRMLEDKGWTGWFRLIKPAGTATLTTYMIPYLLTGFCSMTGLNLWGRFSGWVGVLYCLAYVALVLGIAALLGRFRIRLKI